MSALTDEEIIEIRDSHLPSQGEPFDCLAFGHAILDASCIGAGYHAGYAAGKAAGRAEAAAEIESLRAECGLRQIAGYNKGKNEAAADARDAERYRWLKREANVTLLSIAWRYPAACKISEDADAAIDIALAAK